MVKMGEKEDAKKSVEGKRGKGGKYGEQLEREGAGEGGEHVRELLWRVSLPQGSRG